MHNKRFIKVSTNLFLILALSLLAGGLLFNVTRHAGAEGNSPGSPQATLGTTFTYQGDLTQNNNGVSDACDMKFQLYDAATGGNTASSELPQSVSVTDGIFSVELDFGSSPFTGDGRYLNIAVKCSGDSSYTTMGSRVALNAAPYALSLLPGANVQGSDASNRILGAVNTATSGSGAGLYGEAQSNGGAGVSGWNVGSSSGYAVYGNNTASAGTPYGVYGIASDSGSATSYGVYGKSNSSVGTGVGGIAPTNGVYGEASNSSGTTWGVYGKSNSASGYGVYSNGNAHVEGNLTWKPFTGYVTLPAAAFRPYSNSYSFANDGSGLTPLDAPGSSYLAEVQLPHSATVTKFTFYWADNDGAGDAAARLFQIHLNGTETEMARANTSGSANTASSSFDNTITSAAIDNSTSGYYVWLSFPSADFSAYGVTIEYTISQPY